MSINIKNREAEALLAELKLATGKGTSEIVLELLREAAERLRKLRDADAVERRVDRISRRYRAKLRGPPIPHEEIVGYDEHGLPK